MGGGDEIGLKMSRLEAHRSKNGGISIFVTQLNWKGYLNLHEPAPLKQTCRQMIYLMIHGCWTFSFAT
jgi:hypothetical protein